MTKQKILVIEDTDDVRENIAELLMLSDYEVETAVNGREGVKKAQTNIPDLIICDIMMPELDGYGVLRILSRNAATLSIPFIFLTAKAEKTDFRKGLRLGADDYLTKPFDDIELLDTVEMRLKKSSLIRDAADTGMEAFLQTSGQLNALENLPADCEVRKYAKKQFIFEEEEWPKRLYFVKKGRVKLVKMNDYGKELVLEIVGPNQFLGYTALLKDEVYQASAVAIEASEISLIPKSDFTKLIYENREVAGQFIKMLAGNVIQRENELLQLAYNSVRKRLAETLLKLQKQYGEEGFKVQREDLAAMVGTAKETVIRTLSEFKNEGLIEVVSGKIFIRKEDKLKRMPY